MLKTKANKANCLKEQDQYLSNDISKKMVVKPNKNRKLHRN